MVGQEREVQNGQGFVIMAGLEEIHNFLLFLLTLHCFLVALVSGSWQKLEKVFLNGSPVLQTSLNAGLSSKPPCFNKSEEEASVFLADDENCNHVFSLSQEEFEIAVHFCRKLMISQQTWTTSFS